MSARFAAGDRVAVAVLEPFIGTICGPVSGRENEDIYEVIAPAEWATRNRTSRLQNVFGRSLRQIDAAEALR